MIDLTNIQTYAKSYAISRTQEFIDHPEYWGKKLTEGNLPDMIAGLAEVEYFLYIDCPLDNKDKQIIHSIAKKTSKELIENHERNKI